MVCAESIYRHQEIVRLSLLGVCPKSRKYSIQGANRIKNENKNKNKGDGNMSKSKAMIGSRTRLNIYSAVLLKCEAASIAAPAIKAEHLAPA